MLIVIIVKSWENTHIAHKKMHPLPIFFCLTCTIGDLEIILPIHNNNYCNNSCIMVRLHHGKGYMNSKILLIQACTLTNGNVGCWPPSSRARMANVTKSYLVLAAIGVHA